MDTQHTEQTKRLEDDIRSLAQRFDRHLEIYAQNGKELRSVQTELESVKTNQAWLMRFFWVTMTPLMGGMI